MGNSQNSVFIKKFYKGIIEDLFNNNMITEEEKFECIKLIPKYLKIKGEENNERY